MNSADEFNEKLYITLGKFDVNFSRLEHFLKIFANFLIHPSKELLGMAATSDMPFSALLRVLRSLYDLHETDKKKVQAFYKFLKHIKDLGEERNDIIHSVWYIGFNRETFQKVRMSATLKKGLEIRKNIVKISEIESLSNEIFGASQSLLNLILKTQKEFYEKNSPKTKA